jgi:hypothetical protein
LVPNAIGRTTGRQKPRILQALAGDGGDWLARAQRTPRISTAECSDALLYTSHRARRRLKAVPCLPTKRAAARENVPFKSPARFGVRSASIRHAVVCRLGVHDLPESRGGAFRGICEADHSLADDILSCMPYRTAITSDDVALPTAKVLSANRLAA